MLGAGHTKMERHRFCLQGASNKEEANMYLQIHSGAEKLVFWRQTAYAELLTLLLISSLHLSFLIGGRSIYKLSHPRWMLMLNAIRCTCAQCSNCPTVIKKYEYCKKLLFYDTKTLSQALMKVWKPQDISIKWFRGQMTLFLFDDRKMLRQTLQHL